MANFSAKEQKAALSKARQRLKSSGTAKQMGFEIAQVERGRVVLRMRVKQHHKQALGVVHGGVLAALADTAGGLASYTAATNSRVVTIEMKINYLEGVPHGTVTADARVVRIGKHIAVVDCDLRDDRRLVAKALMSFYVGPSSEQISEENSGRS
ncbi:MAG TPA: PaaI family thioesterase [Candidatus Acidoferrales bacterium]|jgi:uncharacterized protein (TIGR00369 family)|nr:PaaI family thioesterase [Candidatus Acidoferrales bacterium]